MTLIIDDDEVTELTLSSLALITNELFVTGECEDGVEAMIALQVIEA